MEEQLRKLKNKAVTVVIVGLLALTWQFVGYITIKDHINMDDFSSVEVILLYSSYFFLAVLFLSILSLLYTVFRVSMKFKSEKKKEEKNKDNITTPPGEDEKHDL